MCLSFTHISTHSYTYITIHSLICIYRTIYIYQHSLTIPTCNTRIQVAVLLYLSPNFDPMCLSFTHISTHSYTYITIHSPICIYRTIYIYQYTLTIPTHAIYKCRWWYCSICLQTSTQRAYHCCLLRSCDRTMASDGVGGVSCCHL